MHGSLHHHPPLTPAGVLLQSRWAALLVTFSFVILAVLAAIDDAAILQGIDEPVTRALLDLRSGTLDEVVKTLSALGGVTVVVAVAGLLRAEARRVGKEGVCTCRARWRREHRKKKKKKK